MSTQSNNLPPGIPVNSDKGYVITTVIGIAILHFLLPPVFVVLGLVLLLMLGIFEIPCIVVALATHHSHAAIPYMIALGALGGLVWVRYAWKLCKRLFLGFARQTKFRYVKGYQGPLSSVLGPAGESPPTPTSASSSRTPRR